MIYATILQQQAKGSRTREDGQWVDMIPQGYRLILNPQRS